MKRTLILILIAILILAGFYALWRLYVSERRDRQRLEENQHTLVEDVVYYRTRDSLSAASAGRLTLTNREFRRHADELKKTVDELQLKVRRPKLWTPPLILLWKNDGVVYLTPGLATGREIQCDVFAEVKEHVGDVKVFSYFMYLLIVQYVIRRIAIKSD